MPLFRLIIRLSLSGDGPSVSTVYQKIATKMPKVHVNPIGPGGIGTGSWEGAPLTPDQIRAALDMLWKIISNDSSMYPQSAPPQNWKIDHVWVYVEDAPAAGGQ